MYKLRWVKTDRWRGGLLSALLVTAAIGAIDVQGGFQLLEWAVFDRYFRLRPLEAPDSRIVLVTIDESDLRAFGRWPLSDRTLARAVRRIADFDPAVIGLNLYRDLPTEPGYQDWQQVMATTPNLIGVDKIIGAPINAPEELAASDRVGFADVIPDGDGRVRRTLLSHPDRDDRTRLSFAARVSLSYLAQHQIVLKADDANSTQQQLGRATFRPLHPYAGGYAHINVAGYQILLHYRGLGDRFETVSLRDILGDRVDPDLLRDRVVLIGSTAQSLNDIIYTPFSNSLFSTPVGSPSLIVQANQVSQILAAALDGRPLLQTPPLAVELVWLLLWATGGALLSGSIVDARGLRRRPRLPRWAILGGSLGVAGSLTLLTGYLLFSAGWWVPAIAPLAACIGSALLVAGDRTRERQRESDRRLLQFLEALPVGICILEADGCPYYSNRRAQEILGAATVPGARDRDAVTPPAFINGTMQPFPEERLPTTRAFHGEASEANLVDVKLGDRQVPLEMWGSPILDRQGRVSFAVIAFQDVTARQKAEAERQRTTRELYELNRSLDRALNAEVELTDAAGRFVPHEFLSFLGYESLVDVELGKAVEKEMSILFSDIRDFTSLSEAMSLEDNFNFINAYLSRMEPAIADNHGFIDKYIGDAIVALFGGSADDAVRAGIEMLRQLDDYNCTRQRPGRPRLRIGIGINTGSLMLGIIGGKHRMDSTVISDAVNLAARLEGLTKTYGLPLLISHATFLQLNDTNQYAIRLIDRLRVKGKSEQTSVFEVFDADAPELKAAKLELRTDFEQAVLFYHVRNCAEAARLFQHCLDRCPGDRVCQIYLDRCRSSS